MMSETLESVATEVDQKELAEQLLAQAKEQGVELVGPNGLLNQLTKNVLETALDAEMAEHLGYDKHDPVGRGSGNSRNGTRAKTVFTEIGPVEVEVPRDTNSSFDPQIVNKRDMGVLRSPLEQFEGRRVIDVVDHHQHALGLLDGRSPLRYVGHLCCQLVVARLLFACE